MDKIKSLKVEGIQYTTVQMDKWLEKSKYLMALAIDNGLELNKYYWRSIFDENYIELFQPNIIDAFTMVIDINGDPNVVNYVLEEYSKVKDSLEKLQYIGKLTEDEIKYYAQKCLENMQIFC